MTTGTLKSLRGEAIIVTAWEPVFGEPKEIRLVWPTGLHAMPQYDGYEVRSDSGLVWFIMKPGAPHIILPPQTRSIQEGLDFPTERRVKKPRKGKNYDWTWHSGKWEKVYV
jgi:hypothetical protein